MQNAEKARFLLKDLKFLHIPKNLIDLCTKRILVMDYMPGIQVNEKEKLEKHVSLKSVKLKISIFKLKYM